MKKILLLSGAVAILSISALAQNTKEQQNKDLKSKNLSTSPVSKDSKEQNKEVKKDTTDWETKVIAELQFTDSQKKKLDSLNQEFNKKIEVLNQDPILFINNTLLVNNKPLVDNELGGIIVPNKNGTSKEGDNEKAEPKGIRGDMSKEEFNVNERMMTLKNERESAFMQLLTPVQLSKYKELVEKKNKEEEIRLSSKPVKEGPVKQEPLKRTKTEQ